MQTIDIDEFPLKWRWTDEKYCLLPACDLAKIHPLSKEASRKVWEESLGMIDPKSDFSPSPEFSTSIEYVSAEDSEVVGLWLQNKIPPGEIIVSWQPNWAVLTEASIFIKYWDEFCYPSSDDVSIWSKSKDWVVHYHHYEKFCYGRSKNV